MLFEALGDVLGFIKPRLRMAIPERSAALFGHLSINFPLFQSVGNNRRDSLSYAWLW